MIISSPYNIRCTGLNFRDQRFLNFRFISSPEEFQSQQARVRGRKYLFIFQNLPKWFWLSARIWHHWPWLFVHALASNHQERSRHHKHYLLLPLREVRTHYLLICCLTCSSTPFHKVRAYSASLKYSGHSLVTLHVLRGLARTLLVTGNQLHSLQQFSDRPCSFGMPMNWSRSLIHRPRPLCLFRDPVLPLCSCSSLELRELT